MKETTHAAIPEAADATEPPQLLGLLAFSVDVVDRFRGGTILDPTCKTPPHFARLIIACERIDYLVASAFSQIEPLPEMIMELDNLLVCRGQIFTQGGHASCDSWNLEGALTSTRGAKIAGPVNEDAGESCLRRSTVGTANESWSPKFFLPWFWDGIILRQEPTRVILYGMVARVDR